jgi:large subunit ribosomal protein L16
MMMPKRVKYRKQQRGRRKGRSSGANKLDFGEFGLQALEPGWITARQIEAARVAVSKTLKKHGKVWVRLFPDKPVSKKPAETRMGKGKGAPEFWVAVARPGRVMFEVEGLVEVEAREAMRLAASKLPIKTRVLKREDFGYEAC